VQYNDKIQAILTKMQFLCLN